MSQRQRLEREARALLDRLSFRLWLLDQWNEDAERGDRLVRTWHGAAARWRRRRDGLIRGEASALSTATIAAKRGR